MLLVARVLLARFSSLLIASDAGEALQKLSGVLEVTCIYGMYHNLTYLTGSYKATSLCCM